MKTIPTKKALRKIRTKKLRAGTKVRVKKSGAVFRLTPSKTNLGEWMKAPQTSSDPHIMSKQSMRDMAKFFGIKPKRKGLFS